MAVTSSRTGSEARGGVERVGEEGEGRHTLGQFSRIPGHVGGGGYVVCVGWEVQ